MHSQDETLVCGPFDMKLLKQMAAEIRGGFLKCSGEKISSKRLLNKSTFENVKI